MKNFYEWFIIWLLTGFFAPYTLYVYTNNGYTQIYLEYLTAFLFLLCLIASAKLGIMNVFLIIRKTPKAIKTFWLFIWNDYKYWRKHGTRPRQQ